MCIFRIQGRKFKRSHSTRLPMDSGCDKTSTALYPIAMCGVSIKVHVPAIHVFESGQLCSPRLLWWQSIESKWLLPYCGLLQPSQRERDRDNFLHSAADCDCPNETLQLSWVYPYFAYFRLNVRWDVPYQPIAWDTVRMRRNWLFGWIHTNFKQSNDFEYAYINQFSFKFTTSFIHTCNAIVERTNHRIRLGAQIPSSIYENCIDCGP